MRHSATSANGRSVEGAVGMLPDRRVRMTRALNDLRAGKPVVVCGEPAGPRGATATLVFAAQHATTATLAFVIRHSCGFVCIALPDSECDRLGVPVMSTVASRSNVAPFRVSVDAAVGITTGISAADRAVTMRALADPATRPADLTRPGHIMVCGVAQLPSSRRPLPEQTALKIVAAAGLHPAAGFSAMVNDIDHGEILPADIINRFLAEHDLSAVNASDLAGRYLSHDGQRESSYHRRSLGPAQTGWTDPSTRSPRPGAVPSAARATRRKRSAGPVLRSVATTGWHLSRIVRCIYRSTIRAVLGAALVTHRHPRPVGDAQASTATTGEAGAQPYFIRLQDFGG